MRKTIATWAVAMVALASTGSLRAHHSGIVYETTPIWVKGTVVRFEAVNPHTIMTLEDESEDGQIRRWSVEGPGQFQLDRMGIGTDVAQVGEVLEFCAFPYKSAAELARIFPEADFSARRSSVDVDGVLPQFVAGHVMVRPDGEKRLWEPHGTISACMRSSDGQRQSWLDFLNSNARAAWCQQREMESVRSDPTMREFVEGINRSLAMPCD